MDKKILKIGHRGAAGIVRENTLASFEKAIELGVDIVELDVHLKDGQLLVIHDVKDIDEETPSLEQALNLINKRVMVNIEMKGENVAEGVASLIKRIGWNKDLFLVSSFDKGELRRFKQIEPEVRLGLIIKKVDSLSGIDDLGFYFIALSQKIASKELIDKLHKMGFKVFVWTVNNKRDIDKMISFGADGIFSDYPNLLFS